MLDFRLSVGIHRHVSKSWRREKGSLSPDVYRRSSPTFAEATVFVVPLRIGSGTRLKILEALAMGKAIVSTSVGAEGLDLKDGEEIFIADEPTIFADAVTRLLTDARRFAVGSAKMVVPAWNRITIGGVSARNSNSIPKFLTKIGRCGFPTASMLYQPYAGCRRT